MIPQVKDSEPTDQLLQLGLQWGALAGLALAVGAWGSDAVSVGLSRVRLVYPSLIWGGLALVALGALAGRLSARTGRTWASLLIWLVTAALMVLVIGHMPYEGRTLTVWFSDLDSWGLPVYRFDVTASTGMVLAGFFALLLFGILGLLQPYRLEAIAGEIDYPHTASPVETGEGPTYPASVPPAAAEGRAGGAPAAAGGRLNARAWLLLLLPLPLVLGVGLINDDVVNRPLRVAPRQVYEAIRTGRTYEGDLFVLSLEKGVNYNAIKAVRGLMSEEFDLTIGASDLGVADTVHVVADFDNGAWVNCRVVADQLQFCYDASQPYLRGLAAVIATGHAPEDCPYCRFSVSDELRSWLQARREGLGDVPHVRRLAQWGSYVQVEAASPDGGYAIECLFHDFSPVTLESCRVVQEK